MKYADFSRDFEKPRSCQNVSYQQGMIGMETLIIFLNEIRVMTDEMDYKTTCDIYAGHDSCSGNLFHDLRKKAV